MYRRPGFESLLEKWTNRDEEAGLYTDIYDGEIWKTFPSSTDNSAQFFTPDTADSHLGIMINLDWFQPFEIGRASCRDSVKITGVSVLYLLTIGRSIVWR